MQRIAFTLLLVLPAIAPASEVKYVLNEAPAVDLYGGRVERCGCFSATNCCDTCCDSCGGDCCYSVCNAVFEGYLGGGFLGGFGGADFTRNPANKILDEDYFLLGGSGRVNLPIYDQWSGQFDLYGENNFADVPRNTTGQYVRALTMAGHVNWRDPQEGLIGAFAGGGWSEDEGLGFDPGTRGDFWFVGGEFQKYWDQFTLYGQSGFIDSYADYPGVSNPIFARDYLNEAWFLRAVGRYFPDDRTLLQTEIAFANGQHDFRDNRSSLISWSVRCEKQLAHDPRWSLFAAYKGTAYEDQAPAANPTFDYGRFQEHLVLVGFRYQFGLCSLKATDRHGATLDIPDIARWVTHGETLE